MSTYGTPRDTATGAGAGSHTTSQPGASRSRRGRPVSAARRAAGSPGRRARTCPRGTARASSLEQASAGSGPRPGRGPCPAAARGRRRPRACAGLLAEPPGSHAGAFAIMRSCSSAPLIVVAVAACAWLAAGLHSSHFQDRAEHPHPGDTVADRARQAPPRRVPQPEHRIQAARGADPARGRATRETTRLLKDVVRREPDNRLRLGRARPGAQETTDPAARAARVQRAAPARSARRGRRPS